MMRQGALFGEPALLYNKPRSNTVWVEESCKLMVISNKDYKLRLGPLHALDAQIKFREFRLMSAFEQSGPSHPPTHSLASTIPTS